MSDPSDSAEPIDSVEAHPTKIFENFLKLDHYRQRLSTLNISGESSIMISFEELHSFNSDVSKALLENPIEYLTYAKTAALAQLQIEDPEYAEKLEEVSVRITDLFGTTTLRKIGANQIGKLIMVNGVVIRATVVKPRTIKAAFECKRCGSRTFVPQDSQYMRTPNVCPNPSCGRKGPFEYVESESDFINLQDLWIQESSDELPAGQLPRSLHCKLIGELVDTARPGDTVSLVGIVRAEPKRVKVGKLNVFDIFIEANSIKVLGKEPETIPDISEINRIRELGRDPWIHRKIMQSIAPSIYGYENVKEAIVYLLFGGVPKELEDIKIRGEINILLVGDPGTAKSQLLRYVSRLAPRGLYTSGKGTTGVGLTAAVLKEKETGEYSLEAGALVLADKGVACIDEIDKMRPEDRATIHETLEQHTVSIAKGGIVATLNARTAVLAAANPVLGRYNAFDTVVNNISLPVTLLSRFDLIFLMRDIPDKEADTKLSSHILNIHAGKTPTPPISSSLLRKYITFARQLKPAFTPEAIAVIQDFYLAMRKASEKEDANVLSIGPRQLEGLTRLAEARARAALREKVFKEDAEAAITIMMKSLEEVGIDVSGSGRIDIDIIMTGKPKSQRDKLQVVLTTIIEKSKETSAGMVEHNDLTEELEKTYSITTADAERLITQLLREGAIHTPRQGYLKKT